ATSSIRSRRTRATSSTSRRRSSSDVSAQRAAASRARATIALSSAGSVACTEPTTSSVAGFSERSSPSATSFAGADMPRLSLDQSRAPVEIDQLSRDPGAEVVLAHVRANRFEPRASLLDRELERDMDRLRLPRDVERVHGERPFAQLLVHPRVLGEDQHAVALVHERRLLRDEVEAVVDRVHEK